MLKYFLVLFGSIGIAVSGSQVFLPPWRYFCFIPLGITAFVFYYGIVKVKEIWRCPYNCRVCGHIRECIGGR